MKKIFLISLFLFVFQSCAPIIGTVGVFSIGAASKEKGIGKIGRASCRERV